MRFELCESDVADSGVNESEYDAERYTSGVPVASGDHSRRSARRGRVLPVGGLGWMPSESTIAERCSRVYVS
jgi:hypothetical protein